MKRTRMRVHRRHPLSRTVAAVAVATLCLLTAGCGSSDGGDSGGSGSSSTRSTSSGSDGSAGSGSSTATDGAGGEESTEDDTLTTNQGADSGSNGEDSGGSAGRAEEPVGNCASYTLPASDQSPKSFSSGTTIIGLRRGYDVSAQVVEATSDDGRYSGEYSLMSGDASFYDGQITVSIEYELVTGFDGQVTSEAVQKAHVCGWTEE
ncbi:hypothetical protein V1460_16035 [Streptomyces sp. SCSIO 30461]|uniref:hypothetical protein n=1 Tax=Streptomyces sp. SCSIO 30461 TaxID=3118085 RepID=UPI0030D37DA3